MQSFMITLMTSSVIMSVLAICYIAVTPLLRKRYAAKGQYYAWLIIVIGLIIPFRPEFGGSMVKITPSEASVPIVQTANGTPLFKHIENTAVSAAANTAAEASASVPFNITWWQIAFLLWAVGVAAILTYQAVRHYLFIKTAARWREKVTDETTLELLEGLKSEMGLSRQIELYQCGLVGTPMLIGLINPRILLPDKEFAIDELYFILKHELVHYKRKDLWYKCLMLLAAAIHWFNPIVHLAVREIEMSCEASCDAEVVRGTDVAIRQHYSETIIGVVRHQSRMKTALSTNFYGGMKGMKQRIYSILDTGKKRTGALILCIVLLLTMGTGAVFAVNTTNDNITEDKKAEVDLTEIDVSGKSDNYKLLTEMAKLNKSMSVAEYNDTISAMAEAAGTDIFTVMSEVLSEIYQNARLVQDFSSDEEEYEALDRFYNDPVYRYIITTLGYSSSELYAALMVGSEVPYAVFTADRNNSFSDEKEYSFNITYHLVYNLPNDKAITIDERDNRLIEINNSLYSYIKDLSEEAFFADGITDMIYNKLDQLTKESSDDLMMISIDRDYIIIDGYSEKYGALGDEQEVTEDESMEAQDQASAQDSEQTETGTETTEYYLEYNATLTAEDDMPKVYVEPIVIDMYSIYEPFGMTYDKEAEAFYYEGKAVREFTDDLTYYPNNFLVNGEEVGKGNFQGAIIGFYANGEIDIHAVRDYTILDANGYGKLIGIEVDS